jgi:hypothetical protein
MLSLVTTLKILPTLCLTFLTGVSVWAGATGKSQHSIEHRAKVGALAIKRDSTPTGNYRFQLVSAVAMRNGNICYQYTTDDARNLPSYSYGIFESNSPLVNYNLEREDVATKCDEQNAVQDLTMVAEKALEEDSGD